MRRRRDTQCLVVTTYCHASCYDDSTAVPLVSNLVPTKGATPTLTCQTLQLAIVSPPLQRLSRRFITTFRFTKRTGRKPLASKLRAAVPCANPIAKDGFTTGRMKCVARRLPDRQVVKYRTRDIPTAYVCGEPSHLLLPEPAFMSSRSSFSDMLPKDRLRGVARILAAGVHRCLELERLAKISEPQNSAEDLRSLPSSLEVPPQTRLTVSRPRV